MGNWLGVVLWLGVEVRVTRTVVGNCVLRDVCWGGLTVDVMISVVGSGVGAMIEDVTTGGLVLVGAGGLGVVGSFVGGGGGVGVGAGVVGDGFCGGDVGGSDAAVDMVD